MPIIGVWQRRLVAISEIALCSSVPSQLALGLLLQLAGLSPQDASGRLSFSYVVALSMADVVLLTVLMVTLMRAHGESPWALWIGRAPIRGEIRHGFALVPLVFVVAVVMMNGIRMIAPGLHNVPLNPLESLASTPGQAVLFGLVAILAGGVREELQRAFLLNRFTHLGGPHVGLVVISVAFGLGHIIQGWDAVIATGTLGALWAFVYLRRGSSVAPVISHAGFNAIELIRVAVV